MEGVEELSGEKVDLSSTGLVNDMCKLCVGGEGEHHEVLRTKANDSSQELEQTAEVGRCALNSDKAVTVLGLKGSRMAVVTRKCMTCE